MTIGVEGVTALLGAGGLAALASWWSRRDRSFAPGTHAVRDDSARDPLARPLRHGCASAEIAVRLDDHGRLQVGPVRPVEDPGNAIGPLVLRPLATRVANNGRRVHTAQRGSFLLMIEILETDPDLVLRAYEVLDAELRAYPGTFTQVSGGIVLIGPVTVLLTGAAVPRDRIGGEAERYVFVDGSFADLSAWGAPPSLVPVVSEHVAWRFGWDGRGEMPVEERRLLHGLVAEAQRGGRRVRFFGVPHRPGRVRRAYWRELSAVGVDLIATTRHRRLGRFLRRRRAARPAPAVPAVSLPRRVTTASVQVAASVRRRLGRSANLERVGTR